MHSYAKKSFGQHFLTNEPLAGRIADALNSFGEIKNVLEVGPGRGMLSKYLIRKYPNLTMVDADKDMIELLRQDELYSSAQILFSDFLKLDLRNLFAGEPLYIIGNFPYNISSQIVIKMIENRDIVPGLVGMFQKEMAERIAHEPGSKEYGAISVLTQAYYQVEYLFTVKEGNFNPPPKVKSAVLRCVRRPDPHLDCDEHLFRTIVKACFNFKRKMIRNALKPWLSPEILKDPYYEQRPEQLSVSEFVKITQSVQSNAPLKIDPR